MKHWIGYLGHSETSKFGPGLVDPRRADGKTAKIDSRPIGVEGIHFGYMEGSGKQFPVVRIEFDGDEILPRNHVPLMRGRHCEERSPNEAHARPVGPKKIDDDAAKTLLRDVFLFDPECREPLSRVCRRLGWEMDFESVLRLRWRDVNWTDYFSVGEFSGDSRNRPVVHPVVQRREVGPAFCLLSASGNEATLDYAAYKRDNDEEGVINGRVRLSFKDSDRSSIEAISWCEPGSDLWEQQSVEKPDRSCVVIGPGREVKPTEEDDLGQAEEIAAEAGEFDPADERDARERQLRAMVLRSGQSAFRKELLRAYQGMCAVSGCRVEEVLEAAHILPYRGEHTNQTQNGLLLRSDLHILFDRGMLWFDTSETAPKTCVSDLLRLREPYNNLHGKALRQPAGEGDRPAAKLLDQHRKGTDAGLH